MRTGRIVSSWPGAGTAKYINHRRDAAMLFVGNANAYPASTSTTGYATPSSTATTSTAPATTSTSWAINPSGGG